MKKEGVIKKLFYFCTVASGAIFLFNFSHCKAEEPILGIDHLIINEIYPAPISSCDTIIDSNCIKEWVELFNPTDEIINLSNYVLMDGSQTKKSLSGELGPDQYYVYLNSSGWLNNSSEILFLLLKNDDSITDQVAYGSWLDKVLDTNITFNSSNNFLLAPNNGQSISRIPNGADTDVDKDDFKISIPTLGETNIKYEAPVIIDEDTGGQVLVTIATAKEKADAQEVLVQGTVTAVPGQLSSSYFYIQDESGGIQIYNNDQDFPTLMEGDFVSVTGAMSTAYGERRIIVNDMIDIVLVPEKHKDLEPPKEIIVSAITDDQIGQYIETTGTVTQTSGDIFSIADSEGKEIKVIIREGTNINKPKMKKGDTFQIAGVLSIYNGAYRILPYKPEDVKIISATSSILPRAGAPPFIYPIFGLALTLLWNIFLTLKRKL